MRSEFTQRRMEKIKINCGLDNPVELFVTSDLPRQDTCTRETLLGD